jgi:bifunctional ADP-heptose synthase (sugar kinase/adenylyltransferase)
MSKIKGVNSVVGFGTREELEGQIKEWNPDILVVGSEYETKEVIGGHFVKQVIFFPKVGEFSTTKILRDR